MLDWLKDILKEAYTPEIDKKVSYDIGRRFVARADFNTLNNQRKRLEAELEQAADALALLNKMDYEGLKKQCDEWQARYFNETAALKRQLAARDYQYAVELAALKEPFSSNAARRMFVRDLVDARLSIKGGRIDGYAEFKDNYRKHDPGAFLDRPGAADEPADTLPAFPLADREMVCGAPTEYKTSKNAGGNQ